MKSSLNKSWPLWHYKTRIKIIVLWSCRFLVLIAYMSAVSGISVSSITGEWMKVVNRHPRIFLHVILHRNRNTINLGCKCLSFCFFLMYFFISLATCFDWSSSSELKYLLFQRRMPLWTLFWMVQGVGLAFASVSITSYYNRLQEQCQPASTFWWDVYCVLNLLHSNWQNEWCECSVFFRIKLFLGCTADIYFILLIYM